MTYYVNRVNDYSDSRTEAIGLFTKTNWTGEGNFCGWYGIEYFNDTKLIAYYIIPNSSMYKPKGQEHIDEQVVNKYFKKIAIGSCYWTIEFQAENEEEAIKQFFNEDY